MAYRILFLLPCTISLVLSAQARLGSLLFADPAGRGIRLVVTEGAQPDRMTIRPEEGDEGRFRKALLARSGPERAASGSIQVLVEKVPLAWQVDGRSRGTLVRIGKETFWRYLPGQVLLVRFTFEGRAWTLQSADLPARIWAP